MTYEITSADDRFSGSISFGDIILLPLSGIGEASLTPARGFDVGAGPGNPVTAEISGGQVGVVLDGRGRPIAFPDDRGQRSAVPERWAGALGLYT